MGTEKRIHGSEMSLQRPIRPVERRTLYPRELNEPQGFEYGAITKGGSAVELHGLPSWEIIAQDPEDMAAQFDDLLTEMLDRLVAQGGSVLDFVSFRMRVSDINLYRMEATRKALGRIWRKHFGRTYFPIELVEVPDGMAQGPYTAAIMVEATALIPVPKVRSGGQRVWFGGQNGFDQDKKLHGDVLHQARHIMRGFAAVMREAHVSFDDAREVFLRIYIDPALYQTHQRDIYDIIRETIGTTTPLEILVLPASAYLEEAALIEMSGDVALEPDRS
jgi:enamine deaminase RidA (YjgF/YER057c/UK114 family)